jgi:hypothetical protein
MKLTESHRLNSAAFTLAMSGTEARLFISWQAYDQRYFVQKIRSFALQEASQFLQFRAYVLNIIAWGTDTRLQEIRKALDAILEHKEDKRRATSVIAGHINKKRKLDSQSTTLFPESINVQQKSTETLISSCRGADNP